METFKKMIQAIVLDDAGDIKSVWGDGSLSGAVSWTRPLTRGAKLQLRGLIESTIAAAVSVAGAIGVGEATLREFLEDAVAEEGRRREAAGLPILGLEDEIEADEGAGPETDVTTANKS